MGFWVYILECDDKSYYTGHTDNLEKRLYEHEQGLFKCYTSGRLPVRLVYCCEVETRVDALARERQIKGWSRRKKQALIAGDWPSLARYSRNRAIGPSTGSGRTEVDPCCPFAVPPGANCRGGEK
ncbi:MAG: GIY-YIG nuclease family protein [Chloroflexota bacterium]